MRFFLFTIIILNLSGFCLNGQTISHSDEGVISYITKQNVYVKFQSTKDIEVGDTLFFLRDSQMVAVLVVNNLSSISCVCTPISDQQFTVGDRIQSKAKTDDPDESTIIAIQQGSSLNSVYADEKNSTEQKEQQAVTKQNISGRVSVSSYSNFSNVTDNSQRLKYTFSLNAQNINDSKLSGEAYISFAHKIKEWSEIQNNLFNGLKIYNLALNYAFNKNISLSIGRKINPKLSNVGAVDGIQYEAKFKPFSFGVFTGTRPDYTDYSFNTKLLQFGGYVSHDLSTQKGSLQSSVGIIEQMNNGYTDRRFAYLQHSNLLIKNLYLFGSFEFDLFNKVMNKQDSTFKRDHTPKLSNLFVLMRYKVFKQLALSVSYSARQNIIYYETYKSIIDQLIDDATLQGYVFRADYRPLNNVSIGVNAGYRFSKQDTKPSKNVNSYLTYSNVPWLNGSVTISSTILQTTYLNGNIYSIGFSRDLIPGKLYGGLNYRFVDYKYQNDISSLTQNMAEMNVVWRIQKKLSCSLNYEGTFEKGKNFNHIYINITQRF